MTKLASSSIPTGTGAPQYQITIFTNRIKHLTSHLKEHKKDNSSKRGLIKLVSKRHKMLRYLKRTNLALYQNTCKELGIRK
ncbi:MAG: 30S ribosomal protein S15 [Bacteroidota bacterium]